MKLASMFLRCSRGLSLGGTSASLSVPAIPSRNISICWAISRLGILLYESRLSAYNSASPLFSYISETKCNIIYKNMYYPNHIIY
ncbi:hypothetical protein HZS_7130 [Henneguya salminicola]|nr:hypothetical protein HZS_7130 [Henneguya salminicola]